MRIDDEFLAALGITTHFGAPVVGGLGNLGVDDQPDRDEEAGEDHRDDKHGAGAGDSTRHGHVHQGREQVIGDDGQQERQDEPEHGLKEDQQQAGGGDNAEPDDGAGGEGAIHGLILGR